MEEWTILRAVAGGVGTILLFGLVLVQPDEERCYRNRLVEWWVSVTHTGENWVGVHIKFSRAVAARVLAGLDALFGSSLISRQFLFGSLCVTSLAGSVLCVFLALDEPQFRSALCFLAVPVVAYPAIRLNRLGIPPALYTALAVSVHLLSPSTEINGESFPGIAIATVLTCVAVGAFGLATDLLAVPLNRAILKRTAHSKSGLLTLITMSVWPLVFVVCHSWLLPAVIADYSSSFGAKRNIATAVVLALSVNSMIALVLLGTLIGLALNAILWSALQRMLHTMHERGPSRTQVMAAGIVLIGMAVTPQPIGFVLERLGLPHGSAAASDTAEK